ncbi:hypothetical protein QBC34DRAFT_147722 [Podospora aff. communis PSN243]|uniref:Uncharacterized protein n=1 Tax=Podospora aff. communis PSN243 TaxID=3040156 RepID=A0AAV9GH39_9PEZI|nr:hypothetical protein QBC34DRAFT_147722 [Podospora aff. communis PSN243]
MAAYHIREPRPMESFCAAMRVISLFQRHQELSDIRRHGSHTLIHTKSQHNLNLTTGNHTYRDNSPPISPTTNPLDPISPNLTGNQPTNPIPTCTNTPSSSSLSAQPPSHSPGHPSQLSSAPPTAPANPAPASANPKWTWSSTRPKTTASTTSTASTSSHSTKHADLFLPICSSMPLFSSIPILSPSVAFFLRRDRIVRFWRRGPRWCLMLWMGSVMR